MPDVTASGARVEYAIRFDVTFPDRETYTTLMPIPWPEKGSRQAALREVTRLTDCADDIKRENFVVLRREVYPWVEDPSSSNVPSGASHG